MKIEALHINMRVRHPQYGMGTVKSISAQLAEVVFSDQTRQVDPQLSELEPAEPRAALSGLDMPLDQLVDRIARAAATQIILQKDEEAIAQLGQRWHGGRLAMHPADASLQAKEVPLEVFFHKIVMMRNNLRVLEQKINGHEKLTDAEKVEMQQYITRCYGSMTTFNVLFKDKQDQFAGS